MLPIPGLTAMPTVLFNSALSLLPDRSLSVRGPDAVAAIAPMFNEESGAARAIRSLLSQDEPLDELLISINGGTDSTAQVVRTAVTELGFARADHSALPTMSAEFERWSNPASPTRLTIVDHVWPVSKAASINQAVEQRLVTAHRVLVVDGDTEFDSGFVRALKDNFYRLRFGVRGIDADGNRDYGYVLEDVALQSGAVRSRLTPPGQPQAAFIAAGRDAEYALSGVIRSGQCSRFTRGAAFGRSRLFTVVGCGFVAKREAFPMPDDTRTEDHDFTLAVQNADEPQALQAAAVLDDRGFRVVSGGRERSLTAYLGAGATLLVRKVAAARFVPQAAMFTDDPPHLSGFLRQVERWNGGALENALKRLASREQRAALRPNVKFTIVASQFENLAGLLLMLLLPVLLGLQYGLPGARAPMANLALWLGADLLVTALLVAIGAWRLSTAGDQNGPARHWSAAKLTARGLLPLLILRSLGAIGYLTAATRVLPAHLARWRLKTSAGTADDVPSAALVTAQAAARPAERPTVTWDRPSSRVRPRAHTRAFIVTGGMALTLIGLFSLAATLGGGRDIDASAWYHTYLAARLEQDDHDALPLPYEDQAPDGGLVAAAGGPILVGSVVEMPAGGHVGEPDSPRSATPDGDPQELSSFCPPSALPERAQRPRTLYGPREAVVTVHAPRDPLSPWGLLILSRLVPLLNHLEEAATAYDLDADLLLQVLLNESFLDPLAVGPTGDLGLAQVTSDALTLISSISTEPASPWHNERLFGREFSVYDPEFSLCAGAAKLAWAAAQPLSANDQVAYALYINPLHGAVAGQVAETHVEPVAAMVALRPLVDLLGATVEAFRQDPGSVNDAERRLLDVTVDLRAGVMDVRGAYAAVATLVSDLRIDDREFYREIQARLYGQPLILGDTALSQ